MHEVELYLHKWLHVAKNKDVGLVPVVVVTL